METIQAPYYGMKDEALVVSNSNEILVMKLKKSQIFVEVDYSKNSFFEDSHKNLLRYILQDSILAVKIRKVSGKIIDALPLSIFYEIEYSLCYKVHEKLDETAKEIKSELKREELPESVRLILEDELFHTKNNIKKYKRRLIKAYKKIKKLSFSKPTKIKRSYLKKLRHEKAKKIKVA